MLSLYGACKEITEKEASELKKIGGYDIYIEYYNQASLSSNSFSLGDTDEEKIVLVSDSLIHIPDGEVLTVASPKKSLVIMCDTLINDGTISMTGKGPNVLPHDYYIIGYDDGYADITIPAYANNQTESFTGPEKVDGHKGQDGMNRQCGAGGIGGSNILYGSNTYFHRNGSGYAFGGGAGSGGRAQYNDVSSSGGAEVDLTYPMRGGNAGSSNRNTQRVYGGNGNPSGYSWYYENYGGNTRTIYNQANGVGGRIIIFCSTFINNGTICADGISQDLNPPNTPSWAGSIISYGGASGGGAIDVFYDKIIEEGILTVNGGFVGSFQSGGNGSITLTAMNLPSMIRPGYLGTKGSTRLVELIKDKFEEVEDKIQESTGQITFDYQNTNTIELAKDKDTKVITANTKISQENENGLYALDDGLYVKFTSFTDEEINLIYNQIQSVSYNTNFTTHDLFAILTKDGYVFKAKE